MEKEGVPNHSGIVMKAIMRTRYGSPDVLELREIDKPIPKDNQVLVKVKAAAVNPYDSHVLRGEPFPVRLMGFGLLKPKHQVLGADVAGQIEAVGKNVTQFEVGDEVFGSGLGAFAEYAIMSASQAVPRPATLTLEQIAAVPIAGLTALQALRNQGQMQKGQHVLINGASGGVGTFAVQIAKSLGAHVTGVCSGQNVEMVRSIGADHVIDYTREDFWMKREQFDLIIDNAAFHSIQKPLRALKSGCIYVGVGGSNSTLSLLRSLVLNPVIAKINGKQVRSLMAKVNLADLVFLKQLMETGEVVPVIDRTYTLSETPDAIRYLEKGHARGKVVIACDNE